MCRPSIERADYFIAARLDGEPAAGDKTSELASGERQMPILARSDRERLTAYQLSHFSGA